MPSDSPLQAIVEYCQSKALNTVPIQAFRDTAPSDVSGTAVDLPYVVVRSEGGSALRDMEGNEFGPSPFSFTVYANTAADCRAIYDTVVWNGQPPKSQAGIETYGALLPYLQGHLNAQVYVDRQEREGRGNTRRGAKIVHTLQVGFKVSTTRS